MKKYILLLFLGITLTLNAQITLPVPNVNVYPLRTQWCAPAVTECVLKYNKININQCTIMDYVRENILGYINPNGYGCCIEIPYSSNPCNKSIALGYNYEQVSVNNLLMYYGNGNLFSTALKGVLPLIKIMDQLYVGQPIIVQWDILDGSGDTHVVVICGIENGNTIKYMDPNGGQILPLSYEKFVENNNHKWYAFLTPMSPYSGNCFNCELDADKGEEGIDCGEGGGCRPCNAPPLNHCFNGIPDEDETGTDCGGADCPACPPPPDPPSIADCTNCERNSSHETQIDCGGPYCPSCSDVEDIFIKDKIYSFDYEVKATNKIIASGNTTVQSGKNVSYITEKTGSIVLYPNFRAEKGSNFNAYSKDLYGYTRACPEDLCTETIWIKNLCFLTWDELSINHLLYAVKVTYEIYAHVPKKGWEYVYGDSRNVTSNGPFFLWDCHTGAPITEGYAVCILYCTVTLCNGEKYGYMRYFNIADQYFKSLPGSPDTPDTPPQFSPPPSNDTPLHSATATPNLVIIPNPNPGVFQLETNFPLTSIGNLKITNLMGATVYETQKVTSNTVQLQNPSSGTFFVVMILKDGAVLTRKMVVQ